MERGTVTSAVPHPVSFAAPTLKSSPTSYEESVWRNHWNDGVGSNDPKVTQSPSALHKVPVATFTTPLSSVLAASTLCHRNYLIIIFMSCGYASSVCVITMALFQSSIELP